MLEDYLDLLPSKGSYAVTPATLRGLHALLSEHSAPRIRHLAFMVIARLGGIPATLYRDEDDDMPQEPSGERLNLLPFSCEAQSL
jgi:hypothetical protein